jgi:uncharacterized protein YkwD
MRAHRSRLLAPALLALVLGAGLVAVAPAAPVAAGTAETMEASILASMNKDRAARGLRPLYRDPRLADLAGDRAAILAGKNVLSHSAAGDLAAQLTGRGIQWYRYGENIGWTTYPWGSQAASNLYGLWKGSPGHWSQMMSDRFNYVGIGVAYRSSGAKTFASIVFTESVDHTPPAARITRASRSGTTVTWTWEGWDRRLQTHTAGLRDFDVQYRTGSGTWRLLRDNTTATSLTLTNRVRGTTVSIRVRSTDRRGIIGTWTAESRVSIP